MALKWTIRRKLFFLAASALVFLAIISAVGYWGTSFESSSGKILQNQVLIRLNLEADMAHDAIRSDVLDAMRLGNMRASAEQEQQSANEAANKSSSGADSSSTEPDAEQEKEIAKLKEGFQRHKGVIEKNSKALLGNELSPEFRKRVQALNISLISYTSSADQLVEQGIVDSQGARLVYPTFESAFLDLEQAISEVTAYIERASQQDLASERAISNRNRAFILWLSALAIFALFIISWWIARSISVPLQHAVKVANAVADGDLTQTIAVKSSDETGQLLAALKRMSEGLHGKMARVVGEVSEASQAILDTTRQLVAGNNSLANRTEAQASTVEETAASAEELAATVKQNAANSQQAKQMAEVASGVAMKGGEVVSQVIETMREIHSRSDKIREITSLIDGIAFQTNILALNAAVEAARAGEFGRGFAVVATEVRSLAQRSATAAKEIKQLIDDSGEKVKRGSDLANQAGNAMHETVESFRRFTPLMFDIANASSEQSEGVDQITQAMTQVDDMTQQNSALVEEASAAAESLERQAANLIDLLKVFKVNDASTARTDVHKPTPLPSAPTPVRASAKLGVKPRSSELPLSNRVDAEHWEEF